MKIMKAPDELQIIRCKCGAIFAASSVPECYADKDWMKDLRKYAAQGYKVETIPCTNERLFHPCTCVKAAVTPTHDQLTLF